MGQDQGGFFAKLFFPFFLVYCLKLRGFVISKAKDSVASSLYVSKSKTPLKNTMHYNSKGFAV